MADRYWVGGTAAWDGTAGSKWALTSGGAGGQAVPTAADDVFFSSLSTGTCTISAGNTDAKSINCTGHLGTIAGSTAISVAGSVTFVATQTLTYTGTITLTATGTLTSGGQTLGFVTVNGSGITVTLGDALTLATTSTFTLTSGTLDLNGFTLSAGIFNSENSNTRSIVFGTSNIALTSTATSTIVLVMNTVTNFTYTGTGGFTRNQAATATIRFGTTTGSITNAPNMAINAGASTLTITNNSWFNNLNFTGSTAFISGSAKVAGDLTIASGGSYAGFTPIFVTTKTFISLGKSFSGIEIAGSGITVTLSDAVTVLSLLTLTQGTLDLNGFSLSAGVISSTNSNTRAITFGSSNITLTNISVGGTIISMATATGFTYTGTGGFIRNMVSNVTATFGSGGGSVTNAPNLTVNAGASALTITANSWFNNLIFTGSTSTVTSTNVNIAGNLTLASGGTYTAVSPTYRDTGTLTSSGTTLSALTVNGASIIVTCADALATTGALTFTLGTLKLRQSATSTVGSLVTSGTTLKYLESTSAGTQATISDTTGTNTVTYLSIKDSNATGGAVFDAIDPTNVNVSNNTGWDFGGGGGGGSFIAFFM